MAENCHPGRFSGVCILRTPLGVQTGDTLQLRARVCIEFRHQKTQDLRGLWET